MLKLTGNTGKSIVVEAMQEYTSTRVYSYDSNDGELSCRFR